MQPASIAIISNTINYEGDENYVWRLSKPAAACQRCELFGKIRDIDAVSWPIFDATIAHRDPAAIGGRIVAPSLWICNYSRQTVLFGPLQSIFLAQTQNCKVNPLWPIVGIFSRCMFDILQVLLLLVSRTVSTLLRVYSIENCGIEKSEKRKLSIFWKCWMK